MGGVFLYKNRPQRQETMGKEDYAVKDSVGTKKTDVRLKKKEGTYGGRKRCNRD